MSKGHYVCQKAAQSIVAEVSPLYVSNDVVQAINIFLDEFILLLVTTAASLDLAQLKATALNLLPHSLGKNVLVEAEIELKNQTEDDVSDPNMNKQMENNNKTIPTSQVISLIQQACSVYCTLAVDDDNHIHPSPTYIKADNMIIAPAVVIYITTIIEHIAEYILNSIAMNADQTDAEQIRVKEVLSTLLDDSQVSSVFNRMNLKENLERNASTYPSNLNTSLPSPTPSPVLIKKDQFSQRNASSSPIHNNNPNINFNEYEQCDTTSRFIRSSNCSIRSSESINDRPLSILSFNTVKSAGSRSRFNFFSSISSGKKDKRTSISLNFSQKKSDSPSVASPTVSSCNTDFEDLIRSGGTKKVTLTPNRLRSIEIKEEVTPWERFNNNVPKINRSIRKKSTDSSSSLNSPVIPPVPSLPRLNRANSSQHPLDNIGGKNNSPPLTPESTISSHPCQNLKRSVMYEDNIEKSSPSSLTSSSTNEDLVTPQETDAQLSRKLSTSSSFYSRHSIHTSDEESKTEEINIMYSSVLLSDPQEHNKIQSEISYLTPLTKKAPITLSQLRNNRKLINTDFQVERSQQN